jgi:hypothetical protein
MRITRFEKAEKFRFFNRSLQVIFFATACFMALFLGWRSLPMIDITREGRYSLTPETIAYLRTLQQPVEIIGSLSLGEEGAGTNSGALGGDRLHELQNLTNRYAAVSSKVEVKWVDGFRAQAEYGFKNPYRILVRSADSKNGESNIWITPEELYLAQDDVFLGERALTSALWRLANPAKRTMIAIVARDRWEAEGPWGFKRLEEFLTAHNATVKQMEPAEISKSSVLEADAIFVLGNSDALTTEGLATLQRTINDHKGNIFFAVDEIASDPLVRFLYFNGIDWPAQRVEEREERDKTPTGEILIRDFDEHPVTEALRRDEQAILSRGHWWALKPRETMVEVSAWPLFKSSPMSVAEGTDTKGPFILMMAIEHKTTDEVPSRLLVAGSSDFLANAYLTYRGNQTFLGSSLDWLLGNSNLLSIPPRSRQIRQLGLNTLQLWHMGGWILGCCLVLLGIGMLRMATKPR